MWYWPNISCAYIRDICAYICKIWSFYDQCCHWDSCTQTTPMAMTMMMMTMMTPMTHDTWQTNYNCIGSLACMPNEPKSSSICSGMVMFSSCINLSLLPTSQWIIFSPLWCNSPNAVRFININCIKLYHDHILFSVSFESKQRGLLSRYVVAMHFHCNNSSIKPISGLCQLTSVLL